MIEAPLPPDEDRRLQSLHQLHILDTPIEERFERITRLLCRILEVPVAVFVLLDETRQWYKSVQGAEGLGGPRKYAFCGHTILQKDDILIVPDTTKDARFSGNPLVTEGPRFKFYAGCSVRAPDGAKVGTLCVTDDRARTINEEQITVLRDLAAMVETELRATFLSQAQRDLMTELDAANRLALIDPLTRLWNRRGLNELLKREWAESARRRGNLALVMADVDHFKKINDTHGHAAGDAALQAISKRLLSTLRTEDAIGRMGGEEFLMILPGAEEKTLPAVLERIRLSIAEAPVETSEGPIPVTISFGASVARIEPGMSVDDMLKAADQALYAAKKNGRNRVELAPPTPAPAATLQ